VGRLRCDLATLPPGWSVARDGGSPRKHCQPAATGICPDRQRGAVDHAATSTGPVRGQQRDGQRCSVVGPNIGPPHTRAAYIHIYTAVRPLRAPPRASPSLRTVRCAPAAAPSLAMRAERAATRQRQHAPATTIHVRRCPAPAPTPRVTCVTALLTLWLCRGLRCPGERRIHFYGGRERPTTKGAERDTHAHATYR
jgi:hypothetical protein